jgi:hypothetical protein
MDMIEKLKREANILCQDMDPSNELNREYARGICELLASVDGVEDVDTGTRSVEIANEIGLNVKHL